MPRPSDSPVFDCLQYAKTEGEGVGMRLKKTSYHWKSGRSSNLFMMIVSNYADNLQYFLHEAIISLVAIGF